MNTTLHALSVWPEWAWAVCALGMDVLHGDEAPAVEPPFWLAIHAGARWGGRDTHWYPRHFRPVVRAASRAGWNATSVDGVRHGRRVRGQALHQGERSAILPPAGNVPPVRSLVAIARVVEVGCGLAGPWARSSAMGWRLADPVVLPEPLSAPGLSGLWPVQGELLERVRADWSAARCAEEVPVRSGGEP